MSKLSERRKQIREYTVGEAEQELERLRRQLFDLRIQQQRGEVKNNRQFTQARTDVARLIYQLDLLERAEAEEALAEEAIEEEEAAGEVVETAEAEQEEAAEGEAEPEEAQEQEAASVVEEPGEEAKTEEEEA